jgi:hypothetical protein
MYSFIKIKNAQYKIHINSRDISPTCFGKKYTTFSEYSVLILKPATNGEIVFTKFHNLYINRRLYHRLGNFVNIISPLVAGFNLDIYTLPLPLYILPADGIFLPKHGGVLPSRFICV